MEYFNPLDKFYKSHTGAVPENTEITFRVKGNFDSVVLLIKKDDESDYYIPLESINDYFECNVSLKTGLYFYCFHINGNNFLGLDKYYTANLTSEPKRFQLTVYDKDYSVPSWLQGGIIYQIFPDRFYRAEKEKHIEQNKVLHDNWKDIPVFEPNEKGQVLNNDFFGGDIKGIIEKLDYIKSLGVTVIYLNPIFKAFSNHRYDTGDYMSIDPLLGTKEDFKKLIDKANHLNIKIVLDGVFNHTGDDSLYFNKYGNYPSIGAYQSKESKYFGWYNFTEYPNKYDSWWGITVLPAINEKNQGFIDFITGENGVLEHYTKMGIGGWRLDVVDELPTEFVRKIRTAVKKVNSDAVIIGEVWEDASNKIAYGVRREYFQGRELDSVMNYPLKNAIIDFIKSKNINNLSYLIKEQIDHYPTFVLNSLMNILSTHDTCRLITVLGGEDCLNKSKMQMSKTFIPESELQKSREKLKIASLLQFTLCGVPSVYYGDETGMQGYGDPLNRQTYPWDNQDVELIKWYKFLGNLRSKYSAFANGEFCEIYAQGGTFIFKRSTDKSEVMIAINLDNQPVTLEFEGKLLELISKNQFTGCFELSANGYAVLVNQDF